MQAIVGERESLSPRDRTVQRNKKDPGKHSGDEPDFDPGTGIRVPPAPRSQPNKRNGERPPDMGDWIIDDPK
jgi:hypothetical protein